jgi:hypothetical protein
MIQMPRRSVTRFFIPLIDVLTLLFCIFLLMPYVKTTGPAYGVDSGTPPTVEPKQPDPAQNLAELARRQEEARRELERLLTAKGQVIQDRLLIHVLEIDPADGKLYYRDPDRVEIADANEAVALAARHKDQGGNKEPYYLILFPRQPSGYPTQRQYKNYDRWFQGVAHSFDIPGSQPSR